MSTRKMSKRKPLPLIELTAITPLDGRYRERIVELAPYVSEYGLIRTRFEIEAKYLVALSDVGLVRRLTAKERKTLDSFGASLKLKDAEEVKRIEAETRHDVKAMERAFRGMVEGTSLADLTEMIHLGLTSEDINNLAYRLMLKRASEEVCIPVLDSLVDELIDRGVDVHYYDLKEGLHVSGHGGQEDIKMLFDICKPKYFIPTGGTIRHMHSYEKLVVSTGRNKEQVFKLKPGDSVEFKNGTATRGQKVKVREVMVHGLGIGDIGKTVLEHRTLLGKEGMVVVVFKATKHGGVLGNPEVVTKGFVFEGISSGLLNDATQRLMKHLKNHKQLNSKKIKDEATKFLEGYFFKTTGRSPMIVPIVVEV